MTNNTTIQNYNIIDRPIDDSLFPNDSLFPAEIWENIISCLDFDDLPKTSLTSRFLKQLSEKGSWGLYCKKIVVFPFNLEIGQNEALAKAFAQIESCFKSFDASNQKKIMTFIEKCNQESIKNQINFTRNFCRSTINGELAKDNKASIQNMITHLLNQPTLSIVCKMKMLDYAKSMLSIVNPNSDAKREDVGLVPREYKPFKLNQVSLDFVSNLYIHPENTFEENELVAVIDRGGLITGESSLYFGRIMNQFGKRWRVNLELKETNQWASIQIKTTIEIGKFLKTTTLPSFCS